MEASNVKAMREALDRIGNIAGFVAENCGDQQTATYMTDIISDVQAALAKPPRNCDVGTAEEQAERYFDYCKRYPMCEGCPHCAISECELAWGQMQYEEGDAK